MAGGGTSIADRDEPRPAESPIVAAERRLEARLRLYAPPLALLGALLLMSTGMRGVLRTFVTMWIHELGHAATAWLCGFAAFPGPWRTLTSDGRVPLLAIAAAAGLAALAVRAWRAERRALAGALGAILLVQAALTLGTSPHRAQMWIVFGGDAGMFVIGALGMATFFAPPGSHLHTSWLRWGFLVMGALAFADAFTTWWAARGDFGAIPFGELEGIGASDPSRLTDDHGWGIRPMIRRFLAVAFVSLAALAAVWGRAVWRDRRAARAAEDA